MTITEMHIDFRANLDKSNGLQYADIAPEAIDLFLNRSMDVLVEQLYKSGEIEQLKELVKNTTFTLSATIPVYNYGTKAYRSTFNIADYLYYQNSKTKVTRTAFPIIASLEYITNDHIPESNAKYYVVDTFNKTFFKYPKVFIKDTSIIVMVDSYTTASTVANGLIFEYISIPTRMDLGNTIDCPLNERLHRKVIDIAVNFMLENLESPRLQADMQLLQEKI
jgi:hypothetical protein